MRSGSLRQTHHCRDRCYLREAPGRHQNGCCGEYGETGTRPPRREHRGPRQPSARSRRLKRDCISLALDRVVQRLVCNHAFRWAGHEYPLDLRDEGPPFLPPIICRPSRADNVTLYLAIRGVLPRPSPKWISCCIRYVSAPIPLAEDGSPMNRPSRHFLHAGFTAAAAAHPSDPEMRARERRGTLKAYLPE